MSEKKEENSAAIVNFEGETDLDSDAGKRAKTFLYKTPEFMSAVMRRQLLQEKIKTYPVSVQSRIRSLKNLQIDQLKLEAEFYEEVYNLEKKYHSKSQPLFDKRCKLVSGEEEPPADEKQNWKSDSDDEELTDKMSDFKIENNSADVKGIPDFWLTVFRNTELLSEMVQEHDEPVLKKLRDIKIVHGNDEKEQSYTIEFHFDKNEFFSNPVLTKQYFLKATVDEDYPFAFEGPEIYKCKGCNIDWEKSMNLTIKTIRKTQKHKERGAVRTITKQVPNDSFFNFFNPPEVSEDKDKIDEESQDILTTDFEIGHFLRARIMPKAILYFTGDIVDDDDDYDEEEELEEEDEEEEDSDDGGNQKKITAGGNKKKPIPNECPNQ